MSSHRYGSTVKYDSAVEWVGALQESLRQGHDLVEASDYKRLLVGYRDTVTNETLGISLPQLRSVERELSPVLYAGLRDCMKRTDYAGFIEFLRTTI